MEIPKAVSDVLSALERAGHRAYLVGGCVRDGLLGRPIHDWDLCTDAHPETVQVLFDRTVPTGLRHGTVTVLTGDLAVEVTTFRSETGYADHRRPDAVCFVTSLEEDLARRDFTINAMALDERGVLIDLFGGRRDILSRCIRCVGEPEARFSEDALRMLRALRFAAQLGFSIEEETAEALERCAPFAASLSAERIRDEVEKALLSPQPQRVAEMACYGLLRAVGVTALPPLDALAALPARPLVRWAALADCAKGVNLRAFRLDRATCRVAESVRAIERRPYSDAELKDLLATHGEQAMQIYGELSGERMRLELMLRSGECIFLRDLAVTGHDLECSGPAAGACLARLLRHVHRVPADNRRETLLALSKKEEDG